MGSGWDLRTPSPDGITYGFDEIDLRMGSIFDKYK